jgi:hypothetical protein
VAALGVVAAVAAPAIAAGLSPVLRDFLGQTVSTSADAPPAEQLALLGILRDPPAQAIVDPATLGTSLLSGIHGIRTGYIRRLPAAPGFPHQLLYTVTSGEIGGPAINPRTGAVGPPPEAANLICVESFEPDGGGGDCTETSVLTSGHWIESSGLDGYGLVPDGVASVVLRYSDHPSETEAVTENTFSFRGYPAPEGPVVNGTPQTSPGPTPEVPSSVTWLNAHGEVIFTRAGSNVAPAKPRA